MAYNDNEIEDILTPYYRLNSATQEIIFKNKCEHPFVSGTMSSIITKELYENFLDHFDSTFLNTDENWAFMSLCLKSKLDEDKTDKRAIQNILKINFEDEALNSSRDFFYDTSKNEYKNKSYLQFSFLDFGKGIVETLKDQYRLDTNQNILFIEEAEVLKYAFKHDTSRHPILNRLNQRDEYIPRGLFDLLSIVKRYEGVLIARSGYGKILFDFSNGKGIEEAFSKFGDESLFFPGTLISLYLPAIPVAKEIDNSSIKPIINARSYSFRKRESIFLFDIINRIENNKQDLYNSLLYEVKKEIRNKKGKNIIYFSFEGYESNIRLSKKIIYFLLADYDINTNNNIVILYPPNIEILDLIKVEILNLSTVVKNYKIHPLPFIYFNFENEEIQLEWLGIYDEKDKVKLNDLLFEQFSLSKSDLNDPNNVVGHLNFFDKFGNLYSNLPKREEIISYYKKVHDETENIEIEKLLNKNNCIKYENDKDLYLINGNYYQYQFIDLINLLNIDKDRDLLSGILFKKLRRKLTDNQNYKYIGITSSCHKILFSLINQNLIKKDDVIFLDNYHSFEEDSQLENVNSNFKYILVCDVIATGFLTMRLSEKLREKNADISIIVVAVNTIDGSFENSQVFKEKYSHKIISLYKHKIKKYKRESTNIVKDLKDRNVIRINPFTNIPITLSIKETNNDNILLSNSDFLKYIDYECIKIGFLNFNNIIHPYFFDTKGIFENISIELLESIFKNIKLDSKDLKIFYPKDSGIKYLNLDILKNRVFKDQSIEKYELERFNTNEGWKFPHTTDYFANIVKGRKILLLDDGSCTGDSLIQMINEIALFRVKEIVLLCLIGRVNDNKREFFSRISQIQNTEPITIKIYFGCHWHIPTYYFDENPNIKERNWLREVIGFQNTPENIKKIARKILSEITPKSITEFKDYKYLPRLRDDIKKIPKKELIEVREHIGKVIGYRFYKEDFNYFNFLIKKYINDEDKVERTKEMELLCSTFLFEPYLYDNMRKVLPDIVDKIEEFVNALIFGNPKKNNKKIDIETGLIYKWDKKDILHLFFIVFKRENFVALKDVEKIKKLIVFVEDADFAINYFLYKILIYFPFDKTKLNKNESGVFLHLFDILLQENLLPQKFIKEVKIFRSFISTLPSSEDYYSKLSVINENYRKLTDSKHHKESILAIYDIMLVDLEVMQIHFDESECDKFIVSWTMISKFIEDILSFSASFPTFFIDRLPLIEGNGEYTLRSIHGKLSELINNLNKDSEFKKIAIYIYKFSNSFLRSNCEIFRIFSKITTSAIEKSLIDLLKEKSINLNDIEITKSNNIGNLIIDFPFYFFIEVIFSEIISNFRHRDKNHKVKLSFKIDVVYLIINIENKMSGNLNYGGGNGLTILEKINDFPEDIIKYSYFNKKETKTFYQELKIKKV